MRYLKLALLLVGTLGIGCGRSDDLASNHRATTQTPGVDCMDPQFCGSWEYAVPVPVAPTVPSVSLPRPPRIGPEIHCNGIDEDGDGFDFCLGDADGDGVPADFDCNDLDASISPFADEIPCDGIDQNCDGIDQCDRDQDGVDDSIDCAPDNPLITTECHQPPERAPSGL